MPGGDRRPYIGTKRNLKAGEVCHCCSNHSNLEVEAEFLMKNLSYLNLNISRTKNGRKQVVKSSRTMKSYRTY